MIWEFLKLKKVSECHSKICILEFTVHFKKFSFILKYMDESFSTNYIFWLLHQFQILILFRGVGSLQKVGGHKNFQAENFSNRIMLSFWYEKVGGHLTHFI